MTIKKVFSGILSLLGTLCWSSLVFGFFKEVSPLEFYNYEYVDYDVVVNGEPARWPEHYGHVISKDKPMYSELTRFEMKAQEVKKLPFELFVRFTENETKSRQEKKPIENEIQVFFSLNKWKLSSDQLEELKTKVLKFKNDCITGSVKARVIGHACSIGSTSYNLKLSKKRAREVERILKELGILIEEVEGVGEVEKSKVLCLNRFVLTKLKCY